MTHKSNKT